MAEDGFYSGEQMHIDEVLAQLASVNSALETAYERWAELENP